MYILLLMVCGFFVRGSAQQVRDLFGIDHDGIGNYKDGKDILTTGLHFNDSSLENFINSFQFVQNVEDYAPINQAGISCLLVLLHLKLKQNPK